MREEKVTWEKIYKDFRNRHPRLKKEVANWQPREYATITITLKSGMILVYNYDDQRAYILNE